MKKDKTHKNLEKSKSADLFFWREQQYLLKNTFLQCQFNLRSSWLELEVTHFDALNSEIKWAVTQDQITTWIQISY